MRRIEAPRGRGAEQVEPPHAETAAQCREFGARGVDSVSLDEIAREVAQSAKGGLLDLSCQYCGAILPAVGARQVLDQMRAELDPLT